MGLSLAKLTSCAASALALPLVVAVVLALRDANAVTEPWLLGFGVPPERDLWAFLGPRFAGAVPYMRCITSVVMTDDFSGWRRRPGCGTGLPHSCAATLEAFLSVTGVDDTGGSGTATSVSVRSFLARAPRTAWCGDLFDTLDLLLSGTSSGLTVPSWSGDNGDTGVVDVVPSDLALLRFSGLLLSIPVKLQLLLLLLSWRSLRLR